MNMHLIRYLCVACTVFLAGLPGCGRLDATESSPRRYTDSEVAELLEAVHAQRSAPVVPTTAKCGADAVSSVGDKAWKAFRMAYPYHVQTIGVTAPDRDGARILVVSEPPPSIARNALRSSICAAFPDAVRSYGLRRKPVGYDGWVEDVVVELSSPDNHLDDAELGAGVEELTGVLFGTMYKAHALALPTRLSGRIDAGAPKLRVSAAELNEWLFEKRKIFVGSGSDARRDLRTLPAERRTGVWRSDDGLLVAWLIDKQAGIGDAQAIFRVFALETDAIIGAVDRRDGGLAIIGRARQTPLDVVPPLRFEEILRLAQMAREEELAQSYERLLPFAGRIASEGRDWAPILLSDGLLDTEFGSLLNITDQMLKSWSQAGNVDYINFRYPKPGNFPFERDLTRILREKFGANQVLFNWNTSGVGSVWEFDGYRIYALLDSGALPVTYGSDAGSSLGQVQTGGLVEYEDRAFRYFAELGNPYLARVVQYTSLYQIFHEFGLTAAGATFNSEAAHQARRALTSEVSTVLVAMTKGDASVSDEWITSQVHSLRLNVQVDPIFAKEYRTAKQSVAKVRGVDPSSLSDADFVKDMARRRLRNAQGLVRIIRDQWGPSSLAVMAEVLANPRSVSIDERVRNELAEIAAQVQDSTDSHSEPFGELLQAIAARPAPSRDRLMRVVSLKISSEVRPVFAMFSGVEHVRDRYARAAQHTPDGVIRTPSLVISTQTNNPAVVGGHNLNSTVTRIALSGDVPKGKVRIVRSDDGLQFQINPADRASAAQLSRIGARNATKSDSEIASLATRELANQRTIRPVAVALEAPATSFRPDGIGESLFGARLAHFVDSAAYRLEAEEARMLIVRAANDDIDILVTRHPPGSKYLHLVDRGRQPPSVEPLLTGPQAARRLEEATARFDSDVQVRFEGLSERSVDQLVQTVASGAGGGGRLPPPQTLQAPAEGSPRGGGWWGIFSRKGNNDGNRNVIRRSGGDRVPLALVATVRETRPDWSKTTILRDASGQAVKLSADRLQAVIDMKIPVSSLAVQNTYQSQLAATSKNAISDIQARALEARTEQIVIEEAARSNATLSEAVYQLRKTLKEELGFDAVEFRVKDHELAGIIISRSPDPTAGGRAGENA